MSLIRSSVVVAAMTLVSRVAGFARDILMAAHLGAGPMADAFFVAFRFPNLFRRWFAEGAFNAAFVPLYARKREAEGDAAAARFAGETVAVLLVVVLALVIGCQIAMPLLMAGLAPGFLSEASLYARAVLLAQITMPYIVFMSLTAMFAGVLNAHDRFALAAFAPALLNLVLIAVLMAPGADPAQTALRLSFGVAAAGILQAGCVFWGIRRAGVRLALRAPRLSPDIKRLFALGGPGAIAAGATQINLVVSQIIASLQPGAIAWLQFADRLYQLPLGVVGIALGVALLPRLSQKAQAGDAAGAQATLNRALEFALALTLPAAAALLAAPEFWVDALLGRGAFGPEDVRATGQALGLFALGLPAFVLAKVFAPAYFAHEDTKGPMKVAVLAMAVNIALGAGLFFGGFGHLGLAAATSVAGWLNAGLLTWPLWRSRRWRPDARLTARAWRLALAAGVLGLGVGFGARVLAPFVERFPGGELALALALASLGLLVYGGLTLALRGASLAELKAGLRRA
ncbi:MAG: murein biosynthesis integral membrane protein MurJ [Maricaulaceae bacterium]